jgi:hypothetical protein
VLAGLGLLACEPRLLLGELVGAGGVLNGGSSAAGATDGGTGSSGVGGAEAGQTSAGASSVCPALEGGASSAPNDGPLPAPWQTSFEDGFCGYWSDGGFCYGDADAAYRVVTSPARTGAFAAAFDIRVDGGMGFHQSRCVRQGQLPKEAYYGAWYYLPEPASEPDNWNLFHFQGGELGAALQGSWDVSLGELPSGDLAAYVLDGRGPRFYEQEDPVIIPIGRWFQLEFYLKRAADATGEIALFQDGIEVLRVTQIPTDDTNFGQWYVGSLAAGLSPPQYTLYVDDVTVRLGP